MTIAHTVAISALGYVVTGTTPPASHPEWFSSSGVPFLTPSDITPGSRIAQTARFVSESGAEAFAKRLLPPRSICFVSIGSTIGKMCMTSERTLTNQQINSIVVDESLAHPTFVYYALQHRVNEIRAIAGGSATPILNKSTFESLQLRVLTLSAQRAVSRILDALDDKIESNRRASALTQTLLHTRFQRVLADPELTRVLLAELAVVTKGVSYRSADLVPSRTSLVTLKSFDRNGGYKREGLKQYAGAYRRQQVIMPGELAVALTDLTQGAEVVGRAVRIPAGASADVLVASLDLALVRPVGDITLEYLWGVLADEEFREHCRTRTSGTTVLHLAGDAIPSYLAPVASKSEQQAFTDFARPLIERADSLDLESGKLAELRGALLPQLLSGQIQVHEASESTAEEIV